MTNGQVGTGCKFADILNRTSVISCLHKFERPRMKHLLLFLTSVAIRQPAVCLSNGYVSK